MEKEKKSYNLVIGIVSKVRSASQKYLGMSPSQAMEMINKGVKEEATTPKGITALSEMYGPAITRDFPEIMIHQPLIGGGGLQGQATEIKIHADHLVRTREKLNKSEV